MNRLFAYFVKLFESDPKWRVRVAATGGCGVLIALGAVWRGRAALSLYEVIATLIGVPAIMTTAGIFLATADVIRRESHRAGAPVPVLLRVLFGAGIWSLLLWVIIVLIAGFPLAIWLGTITWNRPAG